MPTPFMGELKIVAFNFAPQGWAFCNGSLMPINQNQALFSLLGTTYGGNGQTNFALPDLRGKIPMHRTGNNNGFTQGQAGGQQAHTVTTAELPTHAHFFNGTHTEGTTPIPQGQAYANAPGVNAYAPPTNLTSIVPGTVTNVGGSQPHNNMSPYLVLNFVIALQGFFPSNGG
jgi:microcystin-dependent protein